MTAGAAVLALHYQNEVLHPDGRIRVGLDEGDPRRAAVIAAAGRLLTGARARGVPVVSVRRAFRPDRADLPRHVPNFRAAARADLRAAAQEIMAPVAAVIAAIPWLPNGLFPARGLKERV